MQKNVLVIGLGYFGRKVVTKLNSYGQNVMVVDLDEQRVNACLPVAEDGRIGDATNEQFVESLGVQDYDLCIVAIGDNFLDSLQTTSLLKEMGSPYVIARASSDIQEKFLLRNGADRVIFPEKTLAEWTATRYASNHVFDYLPLDDDYAIMEVEMPKNWIGKRLNMLNIRAEYNLNVIAYRVHDRLVLNVDPSQELTSDQYLLVLGRPDDIRQCFAL